MKVRLGVQRDYQLADKLGVPHTLISDVKAGRRKPSAKMIIMAARLTEDASYLDAVVAR